MNEGNENQTSAIQAINEKAFKVCTDLACDENLAFEDLEAVCGMLNHFVVYLEDDAGNDPLPNDRQTLEAVYLAWRIMGKSLEELRSIRAIANEVHQADNDRRLAEGYLAWKMNKHHEEEAQGNNQ